MHRMSCCMFCSFKRSKTASDFIWPRPHAPSGQAQEFLACIDTSDIRRLPSALSFPLAQEFLICIEMFVAALAHAYAFPPSDYTDPLHPPHGMVSIYAVFVEVSHKQNQTNTYAPKRN